MGILNVTPDSFSDGGAYPSTDRALARALEMVEEGATLIDIGGESTRPGADRVDAAEQKRRILDVVEQVSRTVSGEVLVSVDTTLSEVACAALDAGAGMVNDTSAGRDDPEILSLVAERGVPCCLMHMQGTPKTMQDDPQYSDVVEEVREFLAERAEVAQQAGVEPGNIIVDPGIGFGKQTAHNLQLIAQLNRIVELGYPVLLGTSRKRFMGEISDASDPGQRMPA
ncbi:MAG: dihydropteroate synthase, partial [Gammaproteobacteria bacterium]|nr:dihydropteroate synthase [Gammaproteobacteria bacterium]